LDTQFLNEHLRPGQLGHFFVITAFVGALFSAFSYWRSAQQENANEHQSQIWKILGRNGFIIHAAATWGIFVALYYVIANHLFEYNYAFQHSSKALPMKYLLSCFWEGQEGSFMLWAFWHSILGLIVMKTAGQLEARTMAVIGFVQAIIASMLLGLYFGDAIKIGSSPFLLLRDAMQGAPIFQQASYLEFIKDGNGLNPLLQNYWMVIHPPVLFLGFASTLIPFAYTIAALWKGEYQSWIKPTWIWSLFSGAVLGTGIMMGGAWAYESLTFGGYWAWDPVENASLVPWLTLIAGFHTLIVFKATKRSLPVTIILLVLTYLLVWYSTFLTRTGVLGDTSVHAFTGEGKSLYWHLVAVLIVLLIGSLSFMIYRWRKLPRIKEEEPLDTREFWMFIGSFLLLLSAVQISISTSIPVWAPLAKWISGKDIAPPVNPVKHYNDIQVWVAIVVTLLSASVLYLKFKKTDMKVAWKRLLKLVLLSLGLTLVIGWFESINVPQYSVLLFSAVFSIVATINYALAIQKKWTKMGAAISHLGFGLMLLGILLSSFKKEVITFNTLGVVMDFGKKSDAENARESQENVILYKNVPVVVGDYWATYQGDSISTEDPRTFYKVRYEKKDTTSGKVTESFTLYPDAFVNPKGQQGLIANPASKHYLHKDIFTYITSIVDPKQKQAKHEFKSYVLKRGDSLFLNNGFLVFQDFEQANFDDKGNISVRANLQAFNLKGSVGTVSPIYEIKNSVEQEPQVERLEAMNLAVKFTKVLPDKNAVELMVKQDDELEEYIVMKALLFPYINVLWFGIVVMVIGFFISMYNRITKKEKSVQHN